MPRESKGELKRRLQREGRFNRFKFRREELKRQGTPEDLAWRIAATEFPPMDDVGVPKPSATPPARLAAAESPFVVGSGMPELGPYPPTSQSDADSTALYDGDSDLNGEFPWETPDTLGLDDVCPTDAP